MQQFRRLESATENDVEESKTFIEGSHAIQMEDNFHSADNLSFWETIKDARLADSYLDDIRKVSVKDVKRVAGEFLTGNHTMVVIEQE